MVAADSVAEPRRHKAVKRYTEGGSNRSTLDLRFQRESMSSSNNGGGLQSIPAASRKMVQSLKEIVNCPELEIYAMVKDCNMDPNEAVNGLLSQE
ncbi:hypothetical protein ACSBR2_004356 [Camellia fascicularis]